MTTYKQGDIILVWFPHSDLQTMKKRPAIVLQADNLQTGLDQLIIGMITSNMMRKGHKSRIFIDPNTEKGKHSGLLSNSVIMTDNIATLRIAEIYKKIGEFADLDKLRDALNHTFGINPNV
ncbi:MAG: type II toxin-antitoxin system PemK/MazF family toxin [Candidatus Aminicenantes bacterium]|nr:type II toxin-antitoxin system PemK/MazF family toxin [Candidatus Aminicenantes bacterium]NIM77213.1 type II toxin-antitoxin system PemK/MazF family toxin [Candidatus Aminicenantes bacterium]NIN16508.1 type II toxin-antitoxin system PemK/MazF family toxin [Candidatus Aminicenantes bacterium]NIN40368.1 type II toxin-antitoxin system PemK/MazF family toxin [Candidatus Aminicenantes bacterium]NIN83188.1 type II toxin-antitoxin system PemK/MazF family toxin [Candidatus Aminicenantes bacterium]